MKLIFFPYIFTFFILFTSCEVGKKDKTVENKITVNDSADIEKNDADEKALRLNNMVRLISGKDTILNFRSDLTKKDSFLLFCKNTNKKFEKMEKLRHIRSSRVMTAVVISEAPLSCTRTMMRAGWTTDFLGEQPHGQQIARLYQHSNPKNIRQKQNGLLWNLWKHWPPQCWDETDEQLTLLLLAANHVPD